MDDAIRIEGNLGMTEEGSVVRMAMMCCERKKVMHKLRIKGTKGRMNEEDGVRWY